MTGGAFRSQIPAKCYKAEEIFRNERRAGASSMAPFANTSPDQLPREFWVFDDPHTLKIGGNTVYNQGPTFKCVAYVAAIIREKQVYDERSRSTHLAGGPAVLAGQLPCWQPGEERIVTFSKDDIYDSRQNKFSDGMSGLDAMEIITRHGCIEEREYNVYLHYYNYLTQLEAYRRQVLSVFEQHFQQLYRAGMSAEIDNNLRVVDEKIVGVQSQINDLFYRIRTDGRPNDVYAKIETVDGLRESLVYNGPCLIILPFYQAGDANGSGAGAGVSTGTGAPVGQQNRPEFWIPPRPDMPEKMGHAVTVVGYSDDRKAFFLRNTWGPGWNERGHVWLPYDQFSLAWEAWTVFPKGTIHLNYHHQRKAGAPTTAPTAASATAVAASAASTLLSSGEVKMAGAHMPMTDKSVSFAPMAETKTAGTVAPSVASVATPGAASTYGRLPWIGDLINFEHSYNSSRGGGGGGVTKGGGGKKSSKKKSSKSSKLGKGTKSKLNVSSTDAIAAFQAIIADEDSRKYIKKLCTRLLKKT